MTKSRIQSKFGILSKFNILQTITSKIITQINPSVYHNIDKYLAIKKAFYLSAIEEIEGDYFEFGVYTGSSFCHAIRCAKSNEKFDEAMKTIHFYGYDSFEGFGDLQENDQHRFYTDINFSTNYEKVFTRVKRLTDESRFTLVKGFFEKTLISENPSKSRIVFIDSDTYSSASLALRFLKSSLQEGTIIILDDFFSYKGSMDKGVAGAVNEFIKQEKIDLRQITNYGMVGVIMIVNKLNNS